MNRLSKSCVADYFPYGKVVREFSQYGTERFLTTQHERDAETGLDYRGARYYDSDIARFLSLDPLAAKYPAYSAYCYVAGNPVMFIDPTGKSLVSTLIESMPYIGDHEREKKANKQEMPDRGTANTRFAEGMADGIQPGASKGEFWALMGVTGPMNTIKNWASSALEDPIGHKRVLGTIEGLWSLTGWGMYADYSNAKTKYQQGRLAGSWLKSTAEMYSGISPITVSSRIKVYRVYGNGAFLDGFSWTPNNPLKTSNYRNAAGLPNVNSGESMAIGRVEPSSIIKTRAAIPLDGNAGGLLEYVINPNNVSIKKTTKISPPL